MTTPYRFVGEADDVVFAPDELPVKTYPTKHDAQVRYRGHTIKVGRRGTLKGGWAWHVTRADRPGRFIAVDTLEDAKRVVDMIHAGKVAL